MLRSTALSDHDLCLYEWQLGVRGFGEAGQRRLKGASVLVSRCGGVGGLVALELAAAGVGRLVLYHGGVAQPGDLNRQLLLSRADIGRPRIASIARRLGELNPDVEVAAFDENITEENAERAVAAADVVVDCAPLFQERFALNRAAVAQRKPMVECSMYGLEAQLTTLSPARTPCLRCIVPDVPPAWKRRFPVFGAVSGTVACMGAMEAIKVIAGLGEPLYGALLTIDLSCMRVRRIELRRNPSCLECAGP